MATPEHSELKRWIEWGEWKYYNSPHSFQAMMKGCKQLCIASLAMDIYLFIYTLDTFLTYKPQETFTRTVENKD